MGRAKLKITCDMCGKDQNVLYSRTDNKYYDGDYCLKCYRKIFGENFFDELPECVTEEMLRFDDE